MYKLILYAEDDENDAFFMERALKEAGVRNRLEIVRDGQEAMDYLAGQGRFSDRRLFPPPFLVLLDLKLPRVSGLEVLEWIRGQGAGARPAFRDLDVVALACSNDDENIEKALGIGANGYIVKPPSAGTLRLMIRMLGEGNFNRDGSAGARPTAGARPQLAHGHRRAVRSAGR